MKLLFKATLEKECLNGVLVKSIFEAYDDHTLYLTLDPNPDYNKATSPWPVAQKEASWNWDKYKKVIQVRFLDDNIRLWYVEQELLTKTYLQLLEELVTE